MTLQQLEETVLAESHSSKQNYIDDPVFLMRHKTWAQATVLRKCCKPKAIKYCMLSTTLIRESHQNQMQKNASRAPPFCMHYPFINNIRINIRWGKTCTNVRHTFHWQFALYSISRFATKMNQELKLSSREHLEIDGQKERVTLTEDMMRNLIFISMTIYLWIFLSIYLIDSPWNSVAENISKLMVRKKGLPWQKTWWEN
jgi:hypothetical protein